MRFKVVSNSEKEYLKEHDCFIKLPIIEHQTMVPLYMALSGTNIMKNYRNGVRAQSGVICKKIRYLKGTYISPLVTYTMIYIDVVEHYKKLHDEAVINGDYTIDIKTKDTKKITYQLKNVSLGFQEQNYLQNIMPTVIGDMIEEQLYVKKQLEINNLKLV